MKRLIFSSFKFPSRNVHGSEYIIFLFCAGRHKNYFHKYWHGVSSGWVWVLQLEDWRLVGNGRAAEVSPCVLTCWDIFLNVLYLFFIFKWRAKSSVWKKMVVQRWSEVFPHSNFSVLSKRNWELCVVTGCNFQVFFACSGWPEGCPVLWVGGAAQGSLFSSRSIAECLIKAGSRGSQFAPSIRIGCSIGGKKHQSLFLNVQCE